MSSMMQLRSLYLILTSRCNLACSYCYQNGRSSRRMGRRTLASALDLLLGAGQDELSVTFSGGEPLLEFPAICWATEYLHTHASPQKRIRSTLFTNGVLLTEAVSDYLVENRFDLQLSCDGIGPAQEVRGPGTFEILDRVLDSLQRYHPVYLRRQVKVSMTVLPSTLPYLARSFDYFLSKGVRRVVMAPVLTSSGDWSRAHRYELERQFALICRRSLKNLSERGDIPLLLFRPDPWERAVSAGSGKMCGALDGAELTIDVDGRIYGCGAFAASVHGAVPPILQAFVENMKVGDLGALDCQECCQDFPVSNPAANLLLCKEEQYSSYGRCGECPDLARCTVCPLSIGYLEGNEDPRRVPDFICAFNSIALKFRDQFMSRAEVWRTSFNPDLIHDQMRPWLEWAKTLTSASHRSGR